MNKPEDNVVRVDFRTRGSAPEKSGELGGTVASECVRVLEMPQSFRYQVRFDRIPEYDFHAKGFFGNMARSGIVTVRYASPLARPPRMPRCRP